jgi:hypothetical protein
MEPRPASSVARPARATAGRAPTTRLAMGQRSVVPQLHNGLVTMGGAAPRVERPRVPACSSCERVDQLAWVPAVYRAERSTTVVRGQVYSDYGHGGRVRGRATTVSVLGAALAPPRAPKSLAAPAVSLVGAVFFEMVTVLAAAGGDPSAPGIAAFLLVPIAILAAVVWARHRRLRVQGPIAATAIHLWRTCWYCRRCGMITLPTSRGMLTLNARGLGSSVWSLAHQAVAVVRQTQAP